MCTFIKKIWHWGMALPLQKQVLLCGVFGVFLIASAFGLEYGVGVRPCHLCWLQRYGHWALAGVGIVGGLLPFLARPALLGVVFAGLYGLGLGAYQVLVQYKIVPAPESCTSANIDIPLNVEDFMAALKQPVLPPPCDQIDFTIFGLTLAAWNAICMAAMLFVLYKAWRARKA